MSERADSLIESINVELIRSLYDAFVPSVIMTVGFILSGILVTATLKDPVTGQIVFLGAAAGGMRLWTARRGRAEAFDPTLDARRARVLERRFALPYYAFAIVLGAFGVRVFQFPSADLHMLTICLLIGYAAGVAQGMSLRPWIAIPCIIVAVIPAAVFAIGRNDPPYWMMAGMATALVAGGVHSILGRHRTMFREIARRIRFGELARQDALTELPNRLALREWFEERVTFNPRRGLVAVHCLDLNGFKPVNDAYGHPVGDQLLAAVAKRLAWAAPATDIVARLGGDEFAVVQCDLASIDEADAYAHRLVSALSQPFRIDGHTLVISTCVGYATNADGPMELEQMLSRGDEALYVAKRRGFGVQRYEVKRLSAVA